MTEATARFRTIKLPLKIDAIVYIYFESDYKKRIEICANIYSAYTMSDFPIGLREVVPDQTVPEKCKEFIINTGTYVVLKQKVSPIIGDLPCLAF